MDSPRNRFRIRRHASGAVMASVLTAAIVALATGPAHSRPKTDTVVLVNGDVVSCEIKELSRGKLRVKTDFMGTVDIEWLQIAALESDYFFRVEARGGVRRFGALKLERGSDMLEISMRGLTDRLFFPDVVEIAPIWTSFWDRLDGSLSLGFSFTKSSEVTQLTFDWTNLYTAERHLVENRVSSIVTDRGGDDDTRQRYDLGLDYTRLLPGRWSVFTGAAWQRNDELDLEGRVLLDGGLGFYVVRSNVNRLVVSAGVAMNRETSRSSDAVSTSGEGVFNASYSLFMYRSPKRDVSAALTYYPSLTTDDRYRYEFDVRARVELISDLFLDVNYFKSFDSNPPSGEGAKNDTGVVTSVGWTY